ncbi:MULTISPECIES: Rv0909 family putative TA system antitoxin [unclassified Actinobaculum]|jgi:hypothetical protein|uniref:Rv0909 family putative TA system antitoxin n=1 Tax=unclassified Actinobaculum TaxID=2609299 RepID=UPI000D52919E|nr:MULTISPECIES: Rv0909 family putative TA system antitoxin [unclassified Actinobaculum]AWE43134.1 hypothetical protein DDD63_10700 [Actinobaculum sp. 313]MBE6485032.1 antitoxin [Actinomycetaceae bacterium]RTE48306.1 antitoxin [Actinobaculum sp. 352]
MDILDKAKGVLKSEQVEEKSDQILDKAEALASSKLGKDKADTVKKVRNAIDEKIGNEGN